MHILESERDVRLSDLRFRVRIYGAPSATPVVMLHGGALMGSTWRRVCERLPQHRCFAPDMRGHGDSDWAPEHAYHLTHFAEDLRGLIGALDLERPHLVGMSLGGQTALHAVCHGLPVRSLSLVDIGPTLATNSGSAINAFIERVDYPDFEAAVDAAFAFNPRRSRTSLSESLRRSMRQTPTGSWAWKWDPARLATRRARASEAEQLWSLLDRVRCPTLVVRGAESLVLTAELADRFAAALPDASVACVAAAGHTVQSDQPERLAELLDAFWAGVG